MNEKAELQSEITDRSTRCPSAGWSRSLQQITSADLSLRAEDLVRAANDEPNYGIIKDVVWLEPCPSFETLIRQRLGNSDVC